MITWISSEDEKNARKINYKNLCRVMEFVKKQNVTDEMVKYVCDIYDEYKELIKDEPMLLKDSLQDYYGDDFVVDGGLNEANVILSPSDLNAYYTIKELNRFKKDLTIICFDLHSDTYDYNDFLWKGNSFSRLMNEGYVNHYVVMGVPPQKRQRCYDDTNEELRERVHLIDVEELFVTLKKINCKNVFISIDADCFDCRKSRYTSVEYSPSTILNYVSNIKEINEHNYIEKIHECVHVKNELGYSNYYHTGENDFSVEYVCGIIKKIVEYCSVNDIQLGLTDNMPYFQLMEISGYDYGNLSTELVVKLIDDLSLKEVKSDEKRRIFSKNINYDGKKS